MASAAVSVIILANRLRLRGNFGRIAGNSIHMGQAMHFILRAILATWIVIFFGTLLVAQELQIKGAGVRVVTVIESLPFTIEAPKDAPKGSAIFGHQWEYKRETVTATARDNVLEVTAATKGTLVVFCAWWVVDFGAQKVERKTAFVTFAVGEIGPAPVPPVDPPPPTSVAKHLSFVGVTPNTALVAADEGLRTYLKSAGIAVHVVPVADIDKYKMTAAVAKAGGAPCVILQDVDGKVIDQGKMATVAEVKVLVGKYLK